MHVPERGVAPVHVAFKADGARTARQRRGGRRGRRRRHRPQVVWRSPPRGLVVADRPAVVVVSAATAEAGAVVAKSAAAISGVVADAAAAAAAVAFAVTVAVAVVVVVFAITIATGAQRAADEREQLLHVPVELIGQAGDAGSVVRGRGVRVVVVVVVAQHVRLEVYGLGVPRMRSLRLQLVPAVQVTWVVLL